MLCFRSFCSTGHHHPSPETSLEPLPCSQSVLCTPGVLGSKAVALAFSTVACGPWLCSFVSQANIFLRVLDISYNGFGDPGASAVGEALRTNNVLEELNMR